MRKEFLPFSRPSISEEDINAVVAVLRSGWLTTGRQAAEFEQEFKAFCGAPGAVALASATAGMHLALKALGIGPGDEVLTPAMTWVSTANIAALLGARPVFVDADRDTLLAGAEHFEPHLTPRSKVIIPVHFAGAPADMAPLRRLASKHSLFVLEDAAHALGTEYRGKAIGAEGTSIFSFHPIKNITTGEGGMVCSDNLELLEKIKCLKFHGLGVDAYDRNTQGRSPQAEVVEPGFKYNLTDIAAALGRSQLRRLRQFNARRSELVSIYLQKLSGVEEILPLKDPAWPMTHSRHLFIVRLDTDKAHMDRAMFMEELKSRNIGTGIHFKAIHTQKYYRETMRLKPGLLPATEWNSERLFSLPLFPDMTCEDVNDVVEAIKDILAAQRRRLSTATTK